MTTEATKTCRKCGEVKPLSRFYEHALMKDGHLNQCDGCVLAKRREQYRANPEPQKRASRERYQANLERQRQYHRDYYQKNAEAKKEYGRRRYQANLETKRQQSREAYAKNPNWYREHQRKQIARFPEKHRARVALNRAVMDGKIVKEPCHCGDEKAQAHHDDYSKPLEVRWLCQKHHHEAHGKTFYE